MAFDYMYFDINILSLLGLQSLLKRVQNGVYKRYALTTSYHLSTDQQDYFEEIRRIHDQSTPTFEQPPISGQNRFSRLYPLEFNSQTRVERFRMYYSSGTPRCRIRQECTRTTIHQGNEYLLRERSGLQHDMGWRRYLGLQAYPPTMRAYESCTKWPKTICREMQADKRTDERREQSQLWEDPQCRDTSQNQCGDQTSLSRWKRTLRVVGRKKMSSVRGFQKTWQQSQEYCEVDRAKQEASWKTGASTYGGAQDSYVQNLDRTYRERGKHSEKSIVRSPLSLDHTGSRWDHIRDLFSSTVLSTS